METYKLTFQTIPFSVWAAFPLKRFLLPLLEQSHRPSLIPCLLHTHYRTPC